MVTAAGMLYSGLGGETREAVGADFGFPADDGRFAAGFSVCTKT